MMGNRICGPNNSNGVPAGIYDQGGVLIEKWDAWLANLNKIDHESKTVKVATKAYVNDYPTVTAEDGSRVPTDYYSQRLGPNQAVCDYLGKQLVPDPNYGTRCI
jgi:hypothetical protein